VLVHYRSRIVAPMVLACTVALVACGSGATTSTGPTSSTLVVTVSAPIGILGKVTVSGPGGYTRTVTSTDTLRGLPAGSYTISAAPEVTTDSLVSVEIAGTVTNSPVLVSANHTASTTVYYVVRPGSGALWVGWGFAIDAATAVTSSQLARAGSQIPTDTLGAGGNTSEITASAFDLAGNLWVADFAEGQVKEFTTEQLASGVSTPAVTLAFAFPDTPWGLAFDASNNLWVSFYGANAVEEFSVSQVDGFNGTVTSPPPQVRLTVPGAVGLAFDRNGALWVAAYADSTIFEFPPSALGSGGRPSDSLTSTALGKVTGVTFDASGNLWAGTESGLLVNYTATQLAASTPPAAPNQTVARPSRPYRFDQVAFDNSGNLWASTESADVVEYSPAQLAAGGSPAPARTLTVPGEGITAGTYSVAFDPRATGLPIAGNLSLRPAPRAARR
jgi:sugar lactone lactonase YvrE